jgi:3-dehydroquinate synthase
MISLNVDLGQRSYPIHIGAGLLHDAHLLAATIQARQIMLVSNERVAPLYAASVMAALPDRTVRQVILPDGEQYKTLASIDRIITELLTERFSRDALLVALGGGVVGDITGFAAAVYQRGVDFVQIPTTLLAQVDSAVGGKTAVNHALGKNMIGAFHQPVAVLADTDTLSTLSEREFRAGLAEVVKYGLIRDARFHRWLLDNVEAVLKRAPAALAHTIRRSCEIKAEVVAQDEREEGLRAILNLGHTFGHAIETALGYGAWLHGEAVAAGMCLAAQFSCRLGKISEHEVVELTSLLQRCGLPVRPPASLAVESLLDTMAVDKKVRAGQLRLVLLERIGEATVTADYDREALLDTLRAACVADVA